MIKLVVILVCGFMISYNIIKEHQGRGNKSMDILYIIIGLAFLGIFLL